MKKIQNIEEEDSKSSLAELYNNKAEDYDPSIGEETLIERFVINHQKTSWSGRFIRDDIQTKINRKEVIYSVRFNKQSGNHYFDLSYLCITLPPISVLHPDRIKVSWCESIGHAIFKYATLESGKGGLWEIQKIEDSSILDFYYNYYMKDSSVYNEMIGNIPKLQTPGKDLPETSLVLVHPWFMNRQFIEKGHHPSSIPLFLCSKSTLHFKYRFRLRLKKLLKMKELTSEGWEEIPVKMEYISGPLTLEPPKMYNHYSSITEESLLWQEEENDKKQRVSYIEDFHLIKGEKLYKPGSTIETELNCEKPTKKLFWAARNKKSKSLNDYADYSVLSNKGDFIDPIISFQLKYGSESRVPRLETIHSSLVDPFFFSIRCRKIVGLNSLSFCNDKTDNGKTDSSIMLAGKSAVLKTTLVSSSKIEGFTSDEEQTQESFRDDSKLKFDLIVICIHYNKIIYSEGNLRIGEFS